MRSKPTSATVPASDDSLTFLKIGLAVRARMRAIGGAIGLLKPQQFFLLLVAVTLAVTLTPPPAAASNSLGIPDFEYNALVAFYNSAGGTGWTRNDGWLTTSQGWYGVTISSGHVVQLNLQNNHLVGTIPAELGYLGWLQYLNLRGNQLTGAIPSSLMNLTRLQIATSSISYNGLWTNDAALLSFLSAKFLHWYDTQTIAPTNVTVTGSSNVAITWTPIVYTGGGGYYEVGISSTAGGPYTYDSAKRPSSKYDTSISFSGQPSDRQQYYVVRTCTPANTYNANTVTSDLSAESMNNSLFIPDAEYRALVALYASTGGVNWAHRDRWLTGQGSWYGVTISGGHVVGLNLPTNQMSGQLPTELGALTSLQVLNLRGNQLTGQIPASLANLTQLGGSSYISYNALWNNDSTLTAFLTSKFPNWAATQTVPPTNISARGTTSITVTWTPITYTGDGGYYEIGVSSTPEGPFTFDSSRRTSNKSASSYVISGLATDITVYCAIRTVTSANVYSMVPTTSAVSSQVLTNPLSIPDSEFNALAALYNSTGGPSWTRHDRWLTNSGAWYGVLTSGGHVTQLLLSGNLLTGSLPSQFGDLTSLQVLNLRGNRLMGAIPSSIANLTQLQSQYSTISYNGLWTTDPAAVSFLASRLPNWNLTQTIAPTNVTASGTSGVVRASWTPIQYTADSGYYEVGISDTPQGPYTFDSSRRTTSKTASWLMVNCAPNAPHFFAVRTITNAGSNNASVLTSDPSAEATECTSVKNSSDGIYTAIVGGVVTAVFPDCFYVQAKDRSFGIRATSVGTAVTPGTVDIYGMLISDQTSWERSIIATSVVRTGSDQAAPVVLPVSALGGSSWNFYYAGGPGQVGVTNGCGLNNIGLLVRVCGHITARDSATPATWFRIEDGSGASVKCVVPSGVTINQAWTNVIVTGISTLERPYSDRLRLIRVRSSADIVAF